MMVKLTRREIEDIVTSRHVEIDPHLKDEMAIPTYLHSNPLIRWLFWRRYEVIAHLANIKKNDAVLEFGCGIGVFLPTLCELAKEIYAIDLYPQYAHILVSKYHLRVQFFDNLSEVTNRSIDTIIAADVLEHVENVSSFVGSFAAKLKKNGRLVVSGPTETRLYKIGRWVAGFGDKGSYHHTNINNLKEVIEDSGFRMLDSRALPISVLPLPSLFKVVAFERR